jgi:DNA-binding transcriptional ArsR family regulator
VSLRPLLWQTLGASRGGPNRRQLLQLLAERPRNAHQLAQETQLDYKTVRHHLGVLEEADVIRRSGDEYGAIYLPTDKAREAWDTIDLIQAQLAGDGETR